MHKILFQSLQANAQGELTVLGELPEWLNGSFVRNGPAKFEQSADKFYHWLDGYAMLYKFSFLRGKVKYQFRFLEGEYFTKDQANHKINSSFTFGKVKREAQSWKEQLKTMFLMKAPDNNNVNVIKLDNKYFALSDHNLLVEFDIDTLTTLGNHRFDDNLTTALRTSSAHPCYDPVTDEYYNFLCEPGPVTYYYLYRLNPTKNKREVFAKIARKDICFLHATALTPNYYILIDCPLEATLWEMVKLRVKQGALSEAPKWNADKPSIFHVVNRHTGEITQFELPAFYFFHVANAYEEKEKIVIDLCRLNGGDVTTKLEIEQLEKTGFHPDTYAMPIRYELNMTTKTIHERLLSELYMEMPQINSQMSLRKHRYTYGVSRWSSSPFEMYNQLVKMDNVTEKQWLWRDVECYPSEPIFIPNPAAKTEDDGVVMSVIGDIVAQTSYLLVLDAKSFSELARIPLPIFLPNGIHGAFFPEKDTAISSLENEGFTLNPVG